MTATTTAIPARAALTAAVEANERAGHENRGFLSESHGFMPQERPLLHLPASHRTWDGTAAQLPELFRTLGLRATLDRMPVLSAGAEEFDERFLLRASAILAIFAHAYFYVEPDPPGQLPEAILRPWQQVSKRLHQPGPHLSFNDMNLYNWRLRAERGSDAVEVENLELLIPIVGNEDERRFQMTPVEMSAVFTPIVGAAVRAQEAVVADDVAALKRELITIADTLHELTFTSFPKVDPNRYSPHYVNPVVWGKTVAPMATPFQDDPPPGPSGTAIPAFQLLDAFFGRRRYASAIGRETAHARQWFPQHWRDFLDAVEALSVPDYVARQGERALRGLYHEALQAYAGDHGLLGRHRLKTYGYLDLSFKAGRSKTLGGFAGSFDDRPWDRMDVELGLARLERTPAGMRTGRLARLARVETLRDGPWVGRVTLDVSGTGIRYRPGSRCSVLPENAGALVERTLGALHARGDEPIQLNSAWLEAVKLRERYEHARVLSLRTLLAFGRIRPVDRAVAKALYAMSPNKTLRRVIEARAEDQWELWELVDLLAETGFKPASLWKAHPGEAQSICAIVAPEAPRMFSISSALEPGVDSADEFQLTVGGLRYETAATDVSRAGVRFGTGSNFLAHHADSAPRPRRIAVEIIQPPRFALPRDPRRPVVMVAGGTGISPFLGMLAARARQPDAGESWLYFATRTRADLYGEDDLRRLVADGSLQLRIAFSREDLRGASTSGRQMVLEPARRRHIDEELLADDTARRLWDLLRAREDGGAGAHLYVCGRTGFAAKVEQALAEALARFMPGGPAEQRNLAAELLARLNGEGRYAKEIYTTYPGPHFEHEQVYDASDVVGHNDAENGYWTVINGRVYDLSRFANLHPGGDKIIRSYAGLDATDAYRTARHDVNPEVDAMLGLYEIGAVRRLDFGSSWSVAVSSDGLRLVPLKDTFRAWIGVLYTAVEMENAVANDYGIRAEPVTHDEAAGAVAMSPYKARLLFQTHRRFVAEHLAALTGERFEHLWAVTSGLHSELHDVRRLRRELAVVRDCPAARAAHALDADVLAAFRRAARPGGDPAALDWCQEVCAAVECEDRQVMRDLKHALRSGVRVFERCEDRTASDGADDLLAAVAALPGIVEGYLGRIAALASTRPRGAVSGSGA